MLALGLDAGGTKTDAVICDVAGAVLGFGSSGRGNWEQSGLELATASLGEAVAGALATAGATAGAISSAVFALAGVDWPDDVVRLDPVVASFGLGGPYEIVNDAFAALRAGCRSDFGAVSVAGTASVTAARNRSRETFRTLAIGYGERGGAADLVDAGLDAIARSRHGLAPATLLEPRYLEALGLASADELFRAFNRDGLRPSPALAPLVLRAAADGDSAAIGIAQGMGEGLAASVIGAARLLGMDHDTFEVVRAGGIHRAGSPSLDGAFRAALGGGCPGARPVLLDASPAIGAALLALERITEVDPELHDRLLVGVAGSIIA